MKQNVCNNVHPHGNIINKTNHHYPMPPANPKTWAFYGSMESYRSFVDTNQFCAAAPGVSSGLYNPEGPLTLGCARCTPVYLTNVKASAKFSLNIQFTYSNSELNESVNLEVGKLYNVTYLENGDIKKCTGKCTDIWKINSSETSHYYKIKFDCSVNYANQTVIIKNDQIRGLSLYTGHENQSTTITNSLHRYGTTCGTIKEAVIINATIDSAGNIIEGDIVSGTLEDSYTLDGIATGKNEQQEVITTINSTTVGGSIIEGKILSGLNTAGNIDGEVEEDTGITIKATIKGTIENAIVINAQVKGGTSTGGKIIDIKLINSILYNGTITGDDMVTRGGITIGNITTGGTTVGGTGIGGVAVGSIDGKAFTIENGTTTPMTGDNLLTTGGTVVGGTIIGGEQRGRGIINAIIKGGIVTGGITMNGETSGGNLISTPSSQLSIGKQIVINPNFNDINPKTGKPNNIDKPMKTESNNPYDLVITCNTSTGQVRSNLGTAVVQEVPHLIRTPIKKPYDSTNW